MNERHSEQGEPAPVFTSPGTDLVARIAKELRIGSTESKDSSLFMNLLPVGAKKARTGDKLSPAALTTRHEDTRLNYTISAREFQEVRIPLKELKRAWSEQIGLNLKSITSVNLVSFGMAKDSFAYEARELGFY